MATDLFCGISFSDATAQAAVVESSGNGFELRQLEEIQKNSESNLWFLDALNSIEKKILGKVAMTSVAIDNRDAFLHCFPLDSTLSQTEQHEHIKWETSQFVGETEAQEYVHDMYVLRTNAREQINDVLTVAVKKSTIADIHSNLTSRKLNLKLVDTFHFAAEQALISAYPEMKSKHVAIVGISTHRLDMGVRNGEHLVQYLVQQYSNIEDGVSVALNSLKEFAVSDVVVHGTGVSPEWIKGIRSVYENNLTLLNPFRRIAVARSFKDFDKFLGYEHRFAACIGSAIRNR